MKILYQAPWYVPYVNELATRPNQRGSGFTPLKKKELISLPSFVMTGIFAARQPVLLNCHF
jgi:hypothetical protein